MAVSNMKHDPQLSMDERNLSDDLSLLRLLQEYEDVEDQIAENKQKIKAVEDLKKAKTDAKKKVIEALPSLAEDGVYRCGIFKITVHAGGETKTSTRVSNPRVKIAIDR